MFIATSSCLPKRLRCAPCARAWLCVAAFAIAALPTAARGQLVPETSAVPRETYFLGFDSYNDGDFADAGRIFREAAKSGVRSTEGRWIDSICYHTMIGECYYHMGDLALALDQYDAALQLFVAHRNWMLRIDFPSAIEPSSSTVASTINWGVSKRRSVLGRFPDTMLSLQGRPDNAAVLQQGGVVAPQELYPVRVTEIVRCTTLALSRRRELLGPVCQHDPFSTQLAAVLGARPAPPNHWSQAWIDVQLGIALASAGRVTEAVPILERSLLVGGTYEHPMSCYALLELGKLAQENGQHAAAVNYFAEATYSGALFGANDVMEEAFRRATASFMVINKKDVFSYLAPASTWAKARGSRNLYASILILAAENLASFGNTGPAGALLDQASVVMGRHGLALGAVGARYQYQAATVSFQRGNLVAGNASLALAMTYQKNCSKRMFHIAMVDKAYLSGMFTPRIAGGLFDEVLREPTPADWALDPMETLGVVTIPHLLPMEHWFELTLHFRKDPEKALEIADRIRRRRFYSSLPLGGRLIALRWIMEAARESLDNSAWLQRQDFLLKYPAYAELSRQAGAVKAELAKLPLVPGDDDTSKKQIELLASLGKLSALQEVLLHDIALRRDPSDFVFPPIKTFKQLQQEIPRGQLTLSFLSTGRSVYAFGLTKDKYQVWQLPEAPKIMREVAAMYKGLGMFERNQALDSKDLAGETWKASAAKILDIVSNKAKPEIWNKFEEIVVVPDNILWYVPFEILQVTEGKTTVPLASKARIRYAPTVSLSVPDHRLHKPETNTAVVVGKLMPRDSEEPAVSTFEDLRSVMPGTARLDLKHPAPSAWYGTLFDRLVVLDDIDDATGPYDWAPVQYDRGKPGSTLGNWFALPWGGPQQVVLPGFHTAAENGHKLVGPGDEIFLTLCGLMSTGTRTILLSRWRTGGQNSYDLVREFTQELPNMSPMLAWQRSLQLARESRLDPDREPRFKPTSKDDPPKAEHPFFWAGYMLVDTAGDPRPPAEPEPPAGVKPDAEKPPDKKIDPADLFPAPKLEAPPELKPGAKPKPPEKKPADRLPDDKPVAEKKPPVKAAKKP